MKQGNEGLREFTHRIRELFRLPEDVDISLTFGCKEPLSGQHLKLEGIGAFDAAVHVSRVKGRALPRVVRLACCDDCAHGQLRRGLLAGSHHPCMAVQGEGAPCTIMCRRPCGPAQWGLSEQHMP